MDGQNKGLLLTPVKHIITTVAVILLGFGMVSHARVFFNTGEPSNLDKLLEARGGTKIYESNVRINGGKAALSVYGFDKHLARLLDDLKQSVIGDFTNPNGMALATIKSDGNVTRLVAVRPDTRQQSIIFKITQTESEYAASSKPTDQGIAGVPSYPSSKPSFFLNNEDTSTIVAVSTAAAAAPEIMKFYDANLKSTGWKTLIPAAASALAVYARGDNICCLMVNQAQDRTMSTITLLHKQKKME